MKVWLALAILALAGWIMHKLRARPALPRGFPSHPLFGKGRFQCRNQFEADHILRGIAVADEYDIEGALFAPDDVVIDIGAHIGVFSYLCHIQGSRAIYCFEPAQQNFQWLEKNLASLPGVHLQQVAVWRSDREDSPTLLLSGPDGVNTGAHSVVAAGRIIHFPSQNVVYPSGESRTTETIPLDRILRQFERVKLLKLDCEGSEFPILLTSQELGRVERMVGEIHEYTEQVMEMLDPQARVVGYTAYRLATLVDRLESLGFSVNTRWGDGADPHMYWVDARRGD